MKYFTGYCQFVMCKCLMPMQFSNLKLLSSELGN